VAASLPPSLGFKLREQALRHVARCHREGSRHKGRFPHGRQPDSPSSDRRRPRCRGRPCSCAPSAWRQPLATGRSCAWANWPGAGGQPEPPARRVCEDSPFPTLRDAAEDGAIADRADAFLVDGPEVPAAPSRGAEVVPDEAAEQCGDDGRLMPTLFSRHAPHAESLEQGKTAQRT
jgi:hypothetical protein